MPNSTCNTRFTHAQRKVIAELIPALADRLLLDVPSRRVLPFTGDELTKITESAVEVLAHSKGGMKRRLLRHIIDTVAESIEESNGIGAIPKSERLYQFKITLNESKPPIWRRIQVRNCTLDKLHGHFQTAMGWTNSHLHRFKIDGEIYGDPELLDDPIEESDSIDSNATKIGEVVPKDGKRFEFLYEYDFGDGWQHQVLFEGCLRAEKGKRYPVCIEGERACPPEDVGGVWGFAEFLEVIADPKHEQHEEFVLWGGKFQADKFDALKSTKKMRRGLPDWRLYE